MRFFVLARHAESAANVARVVNGDPARPAPLTPRGAQQARLLGQQLESLPIDLGVASRLLRTQHTMRLALAGRDVPTLTDRDLDEIRAGGFDGAPIDAYWRWQQRHTWRDSFPGGESVDDALRRYAAALRRLLRRDEPVTLVVLHGLALHHIANATSARAPLDGRFGHAVPYLFDDASLEHAVANLEEAAQGPGPPASLEAAR